MKQFLKGHYQVNMLQIPFQCFPRVPSKQTGL